jgi:nanoRNase/pAp phosphatase (c-di-AMP/oligoRNAs hydrolase)
MTISARERVKKFFSCFENRDHVLIAINADPDAIACAMAVKRLLWRKVSLVNIAHVNVIDRPDNLAMIRLLDVNMAQLSQVDLSEFNRYVMVDSQPDHHESFLKLKLDVIIDHHPDTSPVATYCDIRPKYGATASILTEYIRAAKIKPSVKLATGLFHAIKVDTGDFERQTIMEDVRAFQYLYRHANINLAQRMEQGEIRYDYLKFYERALHERHMRNGRIFAYLGSVGNPDICVLIADFFMRVDRARWSVVCGRYEKTLVVIIRNNGLQKHAGNAAKKAFGDVGSAGGHRSMARAEIPISTIQDHLDIKDDRLVQKWVLNRIQKGAPKKAANS